MVMTKEEKKEYYREYYKKNKDLYRERNKKYVKTAEQIERDKQYRKEYYPKYKKEHREEINAYERAWNKKNRKLNGDKVRAAARARYHKNKLKEVENEK